MARSSFGAHSAANWPRLPESNCSAVIKDQFEPWAFFRLEIAASKSPSIPAEARATAAQWRTSGNSLGAAARALRILWASAGLFMLSFLHATQCLDLIETSGGSRPAEGGGPGGRRPPVGGTSLPPLGAC